MMKDWIGFRSLFKKEVMRFLKVWNQTVGSPLISSGLYLLVFGVSLSPVIGEHGGVSYLHFLIPGLVALSALNNALQNSSSSIMVSKFHGDLQDLRLIPMSAVSILLAYQLACVVRAMIIAAAVFLMGTLVCYFREGQWLLPAHTFSLFYYLLVGSLIFANIGISSGFMAKSFDQINAITSFIVVPLIYLGGVFFSLETLHPFWQKLSLLNPLLYLINGIRWGLLAHSDIGLELAAWMSFLFLCLTTLLSWYSVRYGSYQRF